MRGRQDPPVIMLAFVDLETRVPADRQLRALKVLADEALAWLPPEFDRMQAEVGRTSPAARGFGSWLRRSSGR